MIQNKVNSEGVVLEISVKFNVITHIEYQQKYGEHAEIEIQGILDADEKISKVYELNIEDRLILKKKEKILFSGVPVYVSASYEGGQTKVMIKGKSRSILLDLKEKKRSFQKEETYASLIEKVLGEKGILYLQKGLEGKKKEHLVMQYRETDWEFIKRMASHLHAPVCPNIGIEKTGLYIGYPSGKRIEENISTFQLKKNVTEYMQYHAQDTLAAGQDFMTMTIQSLKPYAVGDILSYDGNEYRICFVKMKYTDGMLRYTYRLRNKRGMKWRKKYHSGLAGRSINGKILKVSKDKVKLHLDIDKSQPVEEALWFPVAIGYTAEGSTGLYTAMDEGESVKLFFPSAEEKDAYIRCVNRGDSESSQHYSDPVTKSYGTPYGSCIQTTKKGVLISTVKDEIHIRMDEDDGIEFHSSEKITIATEKKLDMDCKKLKIESGDKIILNTDRSNIIVDETVHIKTKG
ncbi:MAG: hypothetical protein HFJ09_05265 [Lachnospiraceae bacterium]|nr:hypothetical protein [Lachnospiraceae bacterium]